jgi:2-keto-4-pentenoate hydratase/2-oxohepta-3-ene-1,7-dioic acid hydratase in catechol pathway
MRPPLKTSVSRLLAAIAFVSLSAVAARADAVSDFYRGKQIWTIAPSGVGGGYDLYTRFLARYYGKFIPGQPSMVVKNMPGAGGIAAANYMFFGSRSALGAYGDTVMREHGGKQFDFELEVAIVIGREAYRVKAKDADRYIAGYTLANDFTMHFSWWTKLREGRRTNDSIRMKNFPGYTPLSRTVVPRDLVGDPHDLFVKAWIDGKPRQDTRTDAVLWSVQELVEYLSHVMTLRPGDLILSGAPEELPFAPGEPHGIAIGQTLDGRVEKIGRLVNTIGEQTERQPNQPETY